MKYSFNDVTFMIPVRLDSIIRLENILAVVYQIKRLHGQILVYESSTYNNGILKRLLPKSGDIRYRFIQDYDPVFFRTNILNQMTEDTTTPFIAIWDADVIVSPKQLNDAIEALRNEKCDIAFPFNGNFMDTGNTLREMFVIKHNVDVLLRYQSYMNRLYQPNFVGGGIIVNKEKYKDSGKENEKFYGWGPEDMDRCQRWINMNYRFFRSDGPMFHLTHPRDDNGIIRSELHSNICKSNLQGSLYSSKEELSSMK